MRISDWSSDVCSSDLQARFVEAVDDQQRDGQVEEQEAEDQRTYVEPAQTVLHRWTLIPSSRSELRIALLHALEQDDRDDQHQQQEDGDGRGERPVAIVEEFAPQRLADHQGLRSAEQDRKSTRLNSSH